MTNITLSAGTVGVANPATPPYGWMLTSGSVGGIRTNDAGITFFDIDYNYSGWSCIYPPKRTDGVIKAEVTVGNSSSYDSYDFAVTFVDASGAGYMFEVQPFTYRIYKFSSGNLAGTKTQMSIAYTATPPAFGDNYSIEINTTTGSISGYKNGNSVTNAVDTTYTNSVLLGGFALNGINNRNGISDATIYDVSVQYITSINNGSPIQRGQTAIPIVTTGFTGTPTFTSDMTGVAFYGVTGASNLWYVDVSDFSEGVVYPSLPTSITVTATNGSEVAALSSSVVKKTDESLITFASPIYLPSDYLGNVFYRHGITISNGDSFTWKVVSGLAGGISIGIDSGVSFTAGETGQVQGWLRTSSDGKMYYYNIEVTSAGVVLTGVVLGRISIGISIGI